MVNWDISMWRKRERKVTCVDAQRASASGSQLEKEKIHLWIAQAIKMRERRNGRIMVFSSFTFSSTRCTWFNNSTAPSSNLFLLPLLLLLMLMALSEGNKAKTFCFFFPDLVGLISLDFVLFTSYTWQLCCVWEEGEQKMGLKEKKER